jgi:hypothetical protein|tara:strand:+ start:398 stop:772 length:375 start_codon:yes stop_codon:yes gene_type:complete
MAHFAEVNSSNEVLRVVVISNTDVDANGGDQHADAETFVTNLLGHEGTGVAWKQTSFNHNFRKQYAGEGYTYDSSKDIFIGIKPFPSWVLNSDDDWEAPVTYPEDSKDYKWNETTKAWEEVNYG